VFGNKTLSENTEKLTAILDQPLSHLCQVYYLYLLTDPLDSVEQSEIESCGPEADIDGVLMVFESRSLAILWDIDTDEIYFEEIEKSTLATGSLFTLRDYHYAHKEQTHDNLWQGYLHTTVTDIHFVVNVRNYLDALQFTFEGRNDYLQLMACNKLEIYQVFRRK